MASKRKRKSGTWEFIVKNNKFLNKPLYLTFDTVEEGDEYCKRLEALISRGYVPEEYKETHQLYLLRDVIRSYCSTAEMTEADRKILNTCVERIGVTPIVKLDIHWTEEWVLDMKTKFNLSPSTIRHYVGALARCIDWGVARKTIQLENNPLRKLGKKYAVYGKRDMTIINAIPGAEYKHDSHRTRRFLGDEEHRVRRVLNREVIEVGETILKLHYQLALIFLFDMALETGMRMREIFTLELSQIDLNLKTIHLKKTKNGDTREVPMSSVIITKFQQYVKAVEHGDKSMQNFTFADGKLFPWVKNTPSAESLVTVSTNLSKQFARVFQKAKVINFRFHDLRHEATSRLFERTSLDSVEIAKITGHRDPKMLMIYANLRGSHLAAKLW